MSKSALYEQECQRSDLRRMDQRAEVALFDCWETEKEIVLAGDFPGMKPQDIEIEFHEQVLSIRSARAGPIEKCSEGNSSQVPGNARFA
ncbi:MAG: Hsp20 family protein [Rubripirellula sp.]